MKATEQYFPVVLFNILYKVVLAFESVDEILKFIQMKAAEQYFTMVLFIMLYKVGPTFQRLWIECDHRNDNYRDLVLRACDNYTELDRSYPGLILSLNVWKFWPHLKGKYHANLMSFQNPKLFVCQQEPKTNCLVLLEIITPVQSNCRLVSLARDRVGRNGLKLEKCLANVLEVLESLFSKCARTDYEFFLWKIESISFLSLF